MDANKVKCVQQFAAGGIGRMVAGELIIVTTTPAVPSPGYNHSVSITEGT